MSEKFAIVLLAAGKGSRMKSAMPKVLQKIGGVPMIQHCYDHAKNAGAEHIVVVNAPDDAETPTFVPDAIVAHQTEQLGTAHAAKIGIEALETTLGTHYNGKIVVSLGDMAFISAVSMRALGTARDQDVSALAMTPPDPLAYGRMVLADDGSLERIVEYKDATEAEREIRSCNTGTIALPGPQAIEILTKIDNNNTAGEYYLPYAVPPAREMGLRVGVIEAPAEEAYGANTREQLAEMERLFQQRKRAELMAQGVGMVAPETVFVSYDTKIGCDTMIEPHVIMGLGVTIADHVVIKGFSHLEGVTIDEGASVGPYARLRPDTHIGKGARVGNFVETKKADIQSGAKINHLSYIGDACIGADANIGAGTVTCNYDGVNKHQTNVGSGCFVGSNSSLVAPVTIGDNALIAAGSTITEDVSAGDLAFGRARQTVKSGAATAKKKVA